MEIHSNQPEGLSKLVAVMMLGQAEGIVKSENIEDLPPLDQLRTDGEKCAAYITWIVDMLRKTFPNEEIRKLAVLQWDMIGNQMTPFAIGPVPTLSFAAMGRQGAMARPIVMCPQNWHKMCDENPFYQVGAVCFVGSQIKDYYNEKLPDHRAVLARSYAYEAEYLTTLTNVLGVKLETDNYQKKVLAEYPNGLASLPPGLHYESKPFMPSGPAETWVPPQHRYKDN